MSAALKSSRATVLPYLVALIVIAAIVRVAGADVWHVSPDDIADIEIAKARSLSDLLRYSLFETYPPLGHILRHYWLMISDSLWFDRSLSLLFGLALIPLYYLLGDRLAGKWAGLCTATLVAFSNALIVQSFVVRKYTIFLFFLSACIYAWLAWRERRDKSLLPYAALGSLAVLSHFSGLFAVFCIAAAEGVELLRRREKWRIVLRWICANGFIAAVCLGVMVFWLPLLNHTEAEARAMLSGFDWFYHLFCLDYFFIYRTSVPYVFFLSAAILYGLIAAFKVPSARVYAALALFALVLSVLLQLTGIYMPFVPRRNLWLLPFLVPPLGVSLGMLCSRLEERLDGSLVAVLLLAAGTLSYSPTARYSDPHEYMITDEAWEGLTGYLKGLDSSHLILASRADAFLLNYPEESPIYGYYAKPPVSNNAAWDNPALALAVPYHQTRIVFRPLYFGYREKDIIALVANAEAFSQLKDVSNLVITSTVWSRPATLSFILCPELDKTIVAFPPLEAGTPLTRERLNKILALAIIIPRQVFLDELVAPGGKARICLGKYTE